MLTVLIILYALALLWITLRRRAWLLDALIPGLLALFTVAFFWRLVSADVFSPADGGDLGSFLYPTYSFIQDSLKNGAWPLWNPHIYSGVPFVAEIQSGIHYPPYLLRFLLGPDLQYTDMQWLSMLHICWAGVTTYLLVRGLGLWRMPALLAAVAFMFSDLFIIHFGNLNLIAVATWLPLALLGVHHTLAGRGIRWALGAGLALGIGALAGHIQMTLYSLMAVALWVGLWLILTRGDSENGRWRRATAALLIPAAITLGLLAPILLPGFEMAGLSARSEWRYAESVGFSLSPAQLIGLLIPGFFGRGPQFHWGLWPRVEVGYVGILTLVLALVGIAMRRRRSTWILVGLAAASLAFSLGIYAALHGWLTWLLPGLEQLRAPARFIFLFDLALAVLAATGLQALMETWTESDRANFQLAWRPLRSLLFIAVAVGAPVTYAVLLLSQNADPALHLRASISTIAIGHFLLLFLASLALLLARRQNWIRPDLLAVLAVALLLLDLASLGANNDIAETDPSSGYDHPALVDYLRADPDHFRIDHRTGIDQLWQPDTALLHGLEDTWGVVNPLTLVYYADYLEATASRSSDLYALLNVKYVLARKDVVLDWDVWELAFDADPVLNLYLNRRFQPRTFLLGRASVVPDLPAAQAAIGAAAFQPLVEAVLEGGEQQNGSGGSAQVVSSSANSLAIRTDSAAPGTLLISQTWYPGWQASIDDGPWQPVLRANAALQAVQLPAGVHDVQLRFRSTRYTLGLIIAGITLLIVLGLWLRAGRQTHAG